MVLWKCQRLGIKSMAEYRLPITQKDVRAFLGVTGYYWRFIPNYGSVAASLTSATRKSELDRVVWTTERVEAVHCLRKLISDVC